MTLEEEERRLRELKKLVDETAERLMYGNLSLAKAIRLTIETRERAERIIPDMMDKYDLIYESRFQRLIWQFVIPREKEGEDVSGEEIRACPGHDGGLHPEQERGDG